jgi:hypothetical protein
MDFKELEFFNAGEDFTAHAVLSYALQTGQDLTGLLNYLGYDVVNNESLVANSNLLGIINK